MNKYNFVFTYTAIQLKGLPRGDEAEANDRAPVRHLHQGHWNLGPENPLDLEFMVLITISTIGVDSGTF